MDLSIISKEIRDLLEQRRKELELSFVEKEHIYYMKDTDGILKKNFPSVSKVIKKFYTPFDAETKALQMSRGDVDAQQKLLAEWKASGDYSTNMGSRVHYVLETDTIERFGKYKEVREPIFTCDDNQIIKSDNMIIAGKKYLDLMEQRGGILLDTESILGDNEFGYTGQPDKIWLMMNKDKTDFGFVITDWKTNQPKNFEIQRYTERLHPPFHQYHDTALGHYYIQLPLYAKLLIKMLKGTKYDKTPLLGCVIVLLKDDSTYQEYKIPPDVNTKILNMDISKYTKK